MASKQDYIFRQGESFENFKLPVTPPSKTDKTSVKKSVVSRSSPVLKKAMKSVKKK